MDNNEITYSEEIEKVVNQPNLSCPLYGSEECALLNMETCGECPAANLSPEKQEEAKRALGRLMNAAPPEKLEPLYNSAECRLSRERSKAECFAMFDLKKPDPEGNWTIALGKKKLTVKGADMILPVQVACSGKCRARYRAFSCLPILAGLIIAAAGLIVTTRSSVNKALFSVGSFMPFLVMLGFVILAFAVHCALKMILARSMNKTMITDVSEIPEIGELMERGFTEVNDKKFGVSCMVFAKERRKTGVYSRTTSDPAAAEDDPPSVCGIWPCENVPDETDGGEDKEREEDAEDAAAPEAPPAGD